MTKAQANGSDAAFPYGSDNGGYREGLTKREYIAATVMSGMVQSTGSVSTDAKLSVKAADALLAALEAQSVEVVS
jgi:hypothetical protein